MRNLAVVRAAVLACGVQSATVAPMANTTPTSHAIPYYIIVDGAPLEKRVAIRDTQDNGTVARSFKSRVVSTGDTLGRHSLAFALFYIRSAVWTRVPFDSVPLDQGDAYGRYYPSSAGRPALFVPRPSSVLYDKFPSVEIGVSGLRVFSRYGIPTGPLASVDRAAAMSGVNPINRASQTR